MHSNQLIEAAMKKSSQYLLVGLTIVSLIALFILALRAILHSQQKEIADLAGTPASNISHSGEMQMIYNISDSLLPGETKSHTINIDKTSKLSFRFYYVDELKVVVTDPNGVRTDSLSAKQNEISSYINPKEAGMLSISFGNNPPPAKWIVEVSARDRNVKITYYDLRVFFEGPNIKLETETDKKSYFLPDTILVTAILTRGSNPILRASVEARVMTRPRTVVTLPFYDDGTHGDKVANDGRYVLKYYNMFQTGLLVFSIKAYKGGEEPFTKDGDAWVGISKSYAKFDSTFSDYGRDTNGDSLFDELVIKVGVQVRDSDNYTISGELENDASEVIAKASIATILTSKDKSVFLVFNGKDIYKARSNGPYYLVRLYMYMTNTIINGFPVDRLDGAYFTKKYTAWQFQGGPIEFIYHFTDRGIDIDRDGLYDSLLVTVDVNLRQSDYYYWQGILYGPTKDECLYTSNQGFLEVGMRKITIAFDGKEIRRNGKDGPYQISVPAMYGEKYAKEGIRLYENFWTKAYKASQFEK